MAERDDTLASDLYGIPSPRARLAALGPEDPPESGRKGKPPAKQLAALKRRLESEPREIIPRYELPLTALPRSVRTFAVEAGRSLQVEPEMIALFALGHMSGAIGRTRRIRLQTDWTEPALLWMSVVAPPGASKTPALKAAAGPFYDEQWRLLKTYDDTLTEHQKLFSEWEKAPPMYRGQKPEAPNPNQRLIIDTTVEAMAGILQRNPRGLMLSRDELSGWWRSFGEYKSGGGHDRADWLAGWSESPIVVNRKGGPESVRPLTIREPFVAICGGIQPKVLPELRLSEADDDGMMDRFLWGIPQVRWGKTWGKPAVQQDTRDAYDFLMRYLLELKFQESTYGGTPTPLILEMDDDARQSWAEQYNAHHAECAQPDFDQGLLGAWSKFDTQAARLALTVHMGRVADGTASDTYIDERSIISGWALADYFKYGATRVRDLLATSRTDEAESKFLSWMKAKTIMVCTGRDAQRAHFGEPDEIKRLFDALDSHGYGTSREVQLASGGRTRLLFELRGHEGEYERSGEKDD